MQDPDKLAGTGKTIREPAGNIKADRQANKAI
jgi:hypothetical protein